MENKFTKKRGNLVLSQVFLLLIGIFAVAYAVGSEVQEVNGQEGAGDPTHACDNKRICVTLQDDYQYQKTDSGQWQAKCISGKICFDDNKKVTNAFKEWVDVNTVASNELDERFGGLLTALAIKKTNKKQIPPAGPEEEPGGTTPKPTSTSGVNKAMFDNLIGGDVDVTLQNRVSFKDAQLVKENGGTYLKNSEGDVISMGVTVGVLTTTIGDILDPNNPDDKILIAAQTVDSTKFKAIDANGVWAGYGVGVVGNLVEGTVWAGIAFASIQTFGPLFGADSATIDAATKATFWGIMAGKATVGAAEQFGSEKVKGELASWFVDEQSFGLTGAGWIGVGVGAYVFLDQYEDVEIQTIEFTCLPWDAPESGNSCEKCNNGILPCSEYQCRSLGQSCELVNPGTEEEVCVWINRNDVNPPVIQPWVEALLNNDYKYTPDGTINPPDQGVILEYTQSGDNCVLAFTPLRFGITLSEPAKCKIDKLRKPDFESMDVFMSDGNFKYNHTFSLSLPGGSNSQGIGIENDGIFNLFVRCQDSNENFNIGTFSFQYCVDPGPDTTPPLIVSTSIPNDLPIAFNQSSVDLEVYVNEPAECKWDHNNRDYDSMGETMTCSTILGQTNAQGLYTCRTTLTSLKDRFDNQFYFRCKDQPNKPDSDRNENVESLIFTLRGTQPLVIISLEPNDTTIKDSTDTIKVTLEVETTAGADEGKSTCYYSDTGDDDDFIKFFETDSFKHEQDLFLPEDNYQYFIRCTDLGGNTDNGVINFDIESDGSGPVILRAYHEEQYLKLITDEEAECVYDVVDCTYPFEEGLPITVIDDRDHFADWNFKANLYVKCRDIYGNEPLPNECSIIVRPGSF